VLPGLNSISNIQGSPDIDPCAPESLRGCCWPGADVLGEADSSPLNLADGLHVAPQLPENFCDLGQSRGATG